MKTPQEFQAYRNERVIARYAKEHKTDRDTAGNIFVEMMKFLYLCAVLPGSCSPPSRKIDDMWHAFVLHTVDYQRFCMIYVGRFIHHDPTETPFIGNRDQMREVATRTFGELDSNLWHLLTGFKAEACGSSCDGDDYCSSADCSDTIQNSQMSSV